MKGTNMKIYCGSRSFTRDCRPRWLLDELGVPYEKIQVDIFAGEGRNAEYLAINPTGKVPLLEDGGAVIFESGAIVAYLADRYGIPRLCPDLSSPARAEYLQWIFFGAVSVEPPAVRLLANAHIFPHQEGAAERAAQALKDLAAPAKVLEGALASRPYILGDAFSAADIMIGSSLVWADLGRGLGDYPTLKAYLGRLEQRPAFKTTYTPTEIEKAARTA
jgi:glutathione S-transferase